MKRSLIAGATATILLLGCQPAGHTLTEAEKATTEAEIEAAFEDWTNAEDPSVLLSNLAPDVVSVSNTTLNPPVTQEMREP